MLVVRESRRRLRDAGWMPRLEGLARAASPGPSFTPGAAAAALEGICMFPSSGLWKRRVSTDSSAVRLRDTVLLAGESGLDGLAVCHCGPGSEAGTDVCFVKFGAVRPGRQAGDRFERLLDACEQLATERGLGQIEAGMSLARTDAYQRMVARGFRTGLQGVTMHRPNEPGYSHPTPT